MTSQPSRHLGTIDRRSAVALLAMSAAAAVPVAVELSPRTSRTEPPFLLERLIPASFAGWQALEGRGQVVNPQLEEVLDKIYSQVLTRTYVRAGMPAVMLAIAYGNEQRGGLTAHEPELCYPAQGFTLLSNTRATIAPLGRPIAVKRIVARLGSRNEPLTYWFMLGDRPLSGSTSLDRRLVQLRFALSGHVPDGLLFRVSSIEDLPDRAYARHDQFIADLLTAVSPADRVHLIGQAAG